MVTFESKRRDTHIAEVIGLELNFVVSDLMEV
jgi:hypothetical protein